MRQTVEEVEPEGAGNERGWNGEVGRRSSEEGNSEVHELKGELKDELKNVSAAIFAVVEKERVVGALERELGELKCRLLKVESEKEAAVKVAAEQAAAEKVGSMERELGELKKHLLKVEGEMEAAEQAAAEKVNDFAGAVERELGEVKKHLLKVEGEQAATVKVAAEKADAEKLNELVGAVERDLGEVKGRMIKVEGERADAEKVIVRVRPATGSERTENPGKNCVVQNNSRSLLLVNPDGVSAAEQFTFDHVAGESATQEDLFEKAGRPIVENFLAGYNSTMFTFGQTGSGKTHTLFGAEVDKADMDRLLRDKAGEVEVRSGWGMIARVFQLVFALMKQEAKQREREHLSFNCSCSFVEISGQQVNDLLDPKRCNLDIRKGPSGVYVENLTKKPVTCLGQVMELVQRGAKNRKQAPTNMNQNSSRSHCVLSCYIESTVSADVAVLVLAGLKVQSGTHGDWSVVLAGLKVQSGTVSAACNIDSTVTGVWQKSSGATGERLKEASSTNTSLTQLGIVMRALVESLRKNKPVYVPYRDSSLTLFLEDSLGGNSKTTMLACLSPFALSFQESRSTLKFAQMATLIRNKPLVNEAAKGNKDALKKENVRLKTTPTCFETREGEAVGAVRLFLRCLKSNTFTPCPRFLPRCLTPLAPPLVPSTCPSPCPLLLSLPLSPPLVPPLVPSSCPSPCPLLLPFPLSPPLAPPLVPSSCPSPCPLPMSLPLQTTPTCSETREGEAVGAREAEGEEEGEGGTVGAIRISREMGAEGDTGVGEAIGVVVGMGLEAVGGRGRGEATSSNR
ncbi:unnamed protein product [Closterium sp. NIES-65]|nr:unnamed protein product [Closterium sp. NIES-65]